MSASGKQRKLPSSSHQNCHYISTHTTLDQQKQCLATKISKLSLAKEKTTHPCGVSEDNKVRFTMKALKNKGNLTNRLRAVYISEPVTRQTKSLQSRADNVNKVSTNQHIILNNKRSSAQQTKQRHLPGTDIVTKFNTRQYAILNNKRNTDHLTKHRPLSRGEFVNKVGTSQHTLLNNKRNSDQLTLNNGPVTQLLHPDWRKIPWKLYFGWTDSHRIMCKQLQSQVRRGHLESIYYKSAKEHCTTGMIWRYHHSNTPFLGGPAVNTVSEALEMIYRVYGLDVTSRQRVDSFGPGYDGDVEDV